MKIKRIFAENMRQAMLKVREEHGPDAVILSSRNVEGGVEVISAIDYDERVIAAAASREEDAQLEARNSFASTLEHLRRRAQLPVNDVTPERLQRQKINVAVDDDLEEVLRSRTRTVDEPARALNPEALAAAREAEEQKRRTAAIQVEWSQDPVLRELREEVRTLRALFENQVALMEWSHMGRQQPVRALLLRQLADMGLAPDICRKLVEHVIDKEGGVDPERCWERILTLIQQHLPMSAHNLLEEGGIVAMIGPTGVGKTTTVAKLAARFALRHGKQHVALISTDNFRIGAQDQLRSFARILGVPMHVAKTPEELTEVLESLRSKRLVLIDTAGMGQRDIRLSEQFQTLQENKFDIRSYLVLSANAQLATMNEVMRAFKGVRPSACVITKLDEATSLGGVLTAALRYRVPLAYLGVGQRVPEDLTPARGEKLIEKAISLVKRYRQELDDEMLALTFDGTANAS